MSLGKKWEDLGELYTITGSDWSIKIHHCLTEPTSPMVVIKPDGWNMTRYAVWGDSVEKAVEKAVALVRMEIIERKIVGSYAPFSNQDDEMFIEWLKDRANDSDAKLLPKLRQQRL